MIILNDTIFQASLPQTVSFEGLSSHETGQAKFFFEPGRFSECDIVDKRNLVFLGVTNDKGKRELSLHFGTFAVWCGVFAEEFRKAGISYGGWSGNYNSFKDWFKDVQAASRLVVDQFYLKVFGEENGFERHAREFNWTLPLFDFVTLEDIILSRKAEFERRGILGPEERFEDFLSDQWIDSSAFMRNEVFTAMLALRMMEERDFIKKPSRLYAWGVRLIEYQIKVEEAINRGGPLADKLEKLFKYDSYAAVGDEAELNRLWQAFRREYWTIWRHLLSGKINVQRRESDNQ